MRELSHRVLGPCAEGCSNERLRGWACRPIRDRIREGRRTSKSRTLSSKRSGGRSLLLPSLPSRLSLHSLPPRPRPCRGVSRTPLVLNSYDPSCAPRHIRPRSYPFLDCCYGRPHSQHARLTQTLTTIPLHAALGLLKPHRHGSTVWYVIGGGFGQLHRGAHRILRNHIDEILQLILNELNSPAAFAVLSKRYYEFTKDPYVRAMYFLARHGHIQALYWALGRGRLLNERVLDVSVFSIARPRFLCFFMRLSVGPGHDPAACFAIPEQPAFFALSSIPSAPVAEGDETSLVPSGDSPAAQDGSGVAHVMPSGGETARLELVGCQHGVLKVRNLVRSAGGVPLPLPTCPFQARGTARRVPPPSLSRMLTPRRAAK